MSERLASEALFVRLTPDMKDALGRLAFDADVSMSDIVTELIARATGFGCVGYARARGRHRRKVRFYLQVPGAISNVE